MDRVEIPHENITKKEVGLILSNCKAKEAIESGCVWI
jgi:hypothetical protein